MSTSPAPPNASGKKPQDLPVLDSAALLKGGRCALISHNGVIYWLRATRAGKLILTK